jgi:hypothetical protein
MLSVAFYLLLLRALAECHYADCHYAECHYAECHYAECRGGPKQIRVGWK